MQTNNDINSIFNNENINLNDKIKDIDTYFTSKYFSEAKYSKPIKYFIFEDDYKNFRTNVSSSVHPIIPAKRLNLGSGLYGVNFVGLNYIIINENNTDSTGEVFWHEQIHSSNPYLSEKEVRDLIRIKYDFTKYH
jgi:hypothetical protein